MPLVGFWWLPDPKGFSGIFLLCFQAGNLLALASLCTVLWLLALCKAAGEPGLYWETVTTPEGSGPSGSAEQVSRHYLVAEKIRIERGDSTVILRGDRQILYALAPSQKTYTQISFAEMEAMAKKRSESFQALQAKVQKELSALPESSRKQVEEKWRRYEALAGAAGPLRVKPLGQSKEIGGHACQGYRVSQGPLSLVTVYATDDIKSWKDLKKDFFAFQNVLKAWHPGGSQGGLSEALSQIEGFPMETSVAGLFTAQVVELQTREVPAELFEIPKDYQPRKLP
jgi:hypothetical protein